jgi:hypothetical protein
MRVALAILTLTAVVAVVMPPRAHAGLGDSCTLTLSTTGTLKMSMQGNTLGSQETGGGAALMTVVAVGTRPSLTFSAPQLSGPGNSGTSVTSMAFSTLSGINSGYTSSGAVIQLGTLLDTVTINARVVNTQGFRSGTYQITSTVTCQQ